MNSISVRLLLAAAIVLALFIGLTTLAIQHTVNQRSEQAQQARMQGQVYALLGVTEVEPDGSLNINSEQLPNPLLRQPLSGEYAEIRNTQSVSVWQSPSQTTSLPHSTEGAIGEWRFTSEESDNFGPLFITRFAIEWQLARGQVQAYQYVVGSSRKMFDRQRDQFNRNLWIAMLSMGGLLLMCMTLILAWGLRPLRSLTASLRGIESGERDSLPVNVPAELRPLATSMNALVASERGRQKKYRNTLDDLAHSLKTPLSVLRNIGEADSSDADELTRQADRMDEIVRYHIKRADAASKRLLTAALPIRKTSERVTRTLGKAYHRRAVSFDNRIQADVSMRIEEADLMEVFGNVMENACKYGAKNIIISSEQDNALTVINVDDDGPGFPAGMSDKLLRRGIRADSSEEGQGIGLALTRELVESCGGNLTLGQSPAGGARVRIAIPGGS